MRYGPDAAVAEPGYRRYAARQSWTVGADVCQRSWPVRLAIERAVGEQRNTAAAHCNQITWADLAALRRLTVKLSSYTYVPFMDHPADTPYNATWPRASDVGGLTGLRELRLEESSSYFGEKGRFEIETLALPPGFLGHTPLLKELALETADLTRLPAHFLDHAPQLGALRLHADALRRLPPGFLAHAPQLHTLALETDALPWSGLMERVPRLHNLPSDLLARAPQLRTLWLTRTGQEVPRSGQNRNRDAAERRKQPLPTGFLVKVPDLRYLRLHLPFGERLPPGFLNHAPQLRKLVVTAERLTRLPSGFLAHAPQLQCLTLPAHLRSPARAQIPACPEPAPLFGMDRARPGYVPFLG